MDVNSLVVQDTPHIVGLVALSTGTRTSLIVKISKLMHLYPERDILGCVILNFLNKFTQREMSMVFAFNQKHLSLVEFTCNLVPLELQRHASCGSLVSLSRGDHSRDSPIIWDVSRRTVSKDQTTKRQLLNDPNFALS